MSELLFYSSIFILLSNTGGREITKKVYEFWSKGSNRQDIAYVDLEDLVSRYRNNSVAQPFSGTTFNSKYYTKLHLFACKLLPTRINPLMCGE